MKRFCQNNRILWILILLKLFCQSTESSAIVSYKTFASDKVSANWVCMKLSEVWIETFHFRRILVILIIACFVDFIGRLQDWTIFRSQVRQMPGIFGWRKSIFYRSSKTNIFDWFSHFFVQFNIEIFFF